jgi:hypothetical protein
VDIFEVKNEPAKALPELTPPELVDAILQEFRELEYLSDNPNDYQLVIKEKDFPRLKNDTPLAGQPLGAGQLILVEKMPRKFPAGTERPTRHVYLREQTAGKVYKLHWQPAIIGRPDNSQDQNNWIAVNLEPFETGLRVSRRHAKITEEDGQYYIEGLSRNPTSIKDAKGNTRPITGKKELLQDGETILLERSNIALKFIMRAM